ncbi:hypothetical protein [Ferdinandcohnia sp. Marseille-Q9671]
MKPINLIDILFRNDTFKMFDNLPGHMHSQPKVLKPLGDLVGLKEVFKDERTESTGKNKFGALTDTIEITSNNSDQILNQSISLHQANKYFMNGRIQMSGKKKNGKIDTDFCHLLFFLELKSMKEVVIDVKVQNRILSISIYNQTPGLRYIIDALKPTFQSQIENHGYKLSSIKIVEKMDKDSYSNLVKSRESHEKVDVKI